MAGLALALCAAGCTTYLQERDDLRRGGGGDSQRVQQAQQRLDDARASQLSLREKQMMAEEELGALQAELRQVNRNRAVQQGRLDSALSAEKLSAEREAALSGKLETQTDAFNDTSLALSNARMGGSTGDIARKETELGAVRRELEHTNSEIEILSK
jgi:chromosome segregation ATPase